MAIKSLIKFFSNTPVMLMLRIGKLTKETCRTGFVLTAISEGIYDVMQSGPATVEEIQKYLKSDFNSEGLRAWLDLGVSAPVAIKNVSSCGRIGRQKSFSNRCRTVRSF